VRVVGVEGSDRVATAAYFKASLEWLEYEPHPWAKLPSVRGFEHSVAVSERDGEVFVAFEVYGPAVELDVTDIGRVSDGEVFLVKFPTFWARIAPSHLLV
jgi:hypothetical protein